MDFVADAVRILSDDRDSYVPPASVAAATAAGDVVEGDLLTKSTVDVYISAVIELWQVQVAHGNKNTENPRSAAVRGFLEQRGRQRNRLNRASYKDCGTEGIQAGYSSAEWLAIQEHLLYSAATTPQNLRTRVDLLFGYTTSYKERTAGNSISLTSLASTTLLERVLVCTAALYRFYKIAR